MRLALVPPVAEKLREQCELQVSFLSLPPSLLTRKERNDGWELCVHSVGARLQGDPGGRQTDRQTAS